MKQKLIVALGLSALLGISRAQMGVSDETAILGHPQIFVPKSKGFLFDTQVLYVGASFARMSSSPISIWLKNNAANWQGELSYVDSATGTSTPLFKNTDAKANPVILTDLVNIPVGKVMTFEYRVLNKGISGVEPPPDSYFPKYTGPNLKHNYFLSPATSDINIDPSLRYGHRWSVAGPAKSIADEIEFGFEDLVSPTSDMDFNDIIFRAKGIALVTDGKTAKVRSYVW